MKIARRCAASAMLLWLTAMYCAVSAASADRDRVHLFPRLRAGEVFTYQVRYQSEKKIKTESAVAAPMAPDAGELDTQRRLRVDVLEASGDGRNAKLHLRLVLTSLEQAATEKTLEFTLHGDGRVSDERGTETLTVEDRAAIRAWTAQFAMAGIFPLAGVRLGEKWKGIEAVAGAGLAGLIWEKLYTYVRDEPCPAYVREHDSKSANARQNQEQCAVILTTETLKQKSSAKNATPDDFKRRNLRTAGNAHGTNEIVTYIALRNGVLARGTEDAKQSMEAEVALADRENRVHYNIDAHSHTEVLLVDNPEKN